MEEFGFDKNIFIKLLNDVDVVMDFPDKVMDTIVKLKEQYIMEVLITPRNRFRFENMENFKDIVRGIINIDYVSESMDSKDNP